MSSLSQAAALPSRVRKDCDELASNLTSVKAFVAKFVSMGFVHAPAVHKDDAHAGHKERDSRSFICSDLVSFLFSVEKLCASREAALLVCQILEAAGLWNSTIPFGDAVQPIVFHADVVDHLSQERLDAGLRAVRKAIAESVCGHIIKRGVLDKKGRRQQFFDSWKPRFFALRNGIIEHWREQKDFDNHLECRDSLNLLGCKFEVVSDRHFIVRGSSLMNSLELRSKSKDEMLEWRAAIEVAMTPSATSIQEQIDETKDLYSQMADVIQKHIDELGESQSSTALQVSVKQLQDLTVLFNVIKKFEKNETLFVQVTCGTESLRTNCFKVNPEDSSGGIDFGDESVFTFPAIRPTVSISLMSLIPEGISKQAEYKILAHTDLKVGHFLTEERRSINAFVPMQVKDTGNEIALGFSIALSGMEDIFGMMKDDWHEPKKMAQKLDICFHRFRHSVDDFKAQADLVNSKLLLQQAAVQAAFQDIIDDSLGSNETTVRVTVAEARGLMSMDSNGFSDPFCDLIVRHAGTGLELFRDRTQTIQLSLNPRWDWSKEYTFQSSMSVVIELVCYDWDRETAGTVQDVWLPLCDAPAQDSTKHKAMRLFTLKSNPKRGKVHVVVQRLDNPKAGSPGGSQITSEVVRTNLKSLNPRQQKLLEPLLDLDNEMARFVIMSRAVMSEKFDQLSVQHEKLQFQHGHFIDSFDKLFKDDWESFCNVGDRAANVKFQEMHLRFALAPNPLAEQYFLTIQIGDDTQDEVRPKPLPIDSLAILFPDVIDMQCPAQEGNVVIKLVCPILGGKKTRLLASSSFPLKSVALGSHDKQIILRGQGINATLSCRLVAQGTAQIVPQSMMESRARYEAANKSKFHLVKELLLDDGGVLFIQFMNTLDISELDSLCGTVVRVLSTGQTMEKILEKLIEQEVLSTHDEGTLFRRNSPATKLTTAFTREVASSYLAEALGGIIESLIEGPKLELDPSKFPVNGMDPEQQARLLGEKCDQIIQSLITSIDRVPQSVRRLVAVFQRSVEVSFPKSKYIVSTGYLFLRVIVPFITSPDGFGLYHRPIEQSGRRNLLLVGKVLQNLANETNFGAKEVYMVVMNPFMGSALKLLQKYIFDLGQISSTPQKSPTADDRSTIEDQMRLHHMLLKNLSKMHRASTLKQALEELQPPPQNMDILIPVSTSDPQLVFQRAKSVYRFLKEQQDMSHKLKEADQARENKTVEVFQEQIQESRQEFVRVVAENNAVKAESQKMKEVLQKFEADNKALVAENEALKALTHSALA